jgi:hypothetical protein
VLGVRTAIVTPFNADYRSASASSFAQNHLVDHGSDGLVVGATGEPDAPDDEKLFVEQSARRRPSSPAPERTTRDTRRSSPSNARKVGVTFP